MMFIILVSLLIFDVGTSIHLDCEKIQTTGYDKLLGHWYFIGEVSIDIPLTRCGYINVQETSVKGFNASWIIVKHSLIPIKYSIEAKIENQELMEISGIRTFFANVALCVNNTLFYIERVKTGAIFLFSLNMTVASDILDWFEPNNRDFRLYEYVDMNCSSMVKVTIAK